MNNQVIKNNTLEEPKGSDVTGREAMVTMEPQDHYLGCPVAVILVQRAETDEEAWRRHVASHPEHSNIRIRIFHHQ